MENKQKIVSEWIFTMSKGDEIVLTENQYEVYRAQVETGDTRRLFFSDLEINPAFVVSAEKVPANYTKRKYPCRECHSAGRNAENTNWCDNCGGSGVDLPKK